MRVKFEIRNMNINVEANTDYSPAVIEASVQYHAEYSAGSDERGKNSNIVYSGINIIGEKSPKLLFTESMKIMLVKM